jgi:hypothetical protein
LATDLHLRHKDKLMLVDGNNYALSRFHAGRGVRDLFNDIETAVSLPVFVFDGMNANARRRKDFAPYKVHPPEMLKAKENLFPHINLFRELIPLAKCVSVNVPGWEADDVIATIAKSQKTPVHIVSTDRDLSQLAYLPHVTVSAPFEGIPPGNVRLYKTLVGDASDRLPGIPGFGPKSFNGVYPEPLMEALETGSPITVLHGLKPSHLEWCEANRPTLDAFWKIIGLFDVPRELIFKHTKAGASKYSEIDKVLREFLM